MLHCVVHLKIAAVMLKYYLAMSLQLCSHISLYEYRSMSLYLENSSSLLTLEAGVEKIPELLRDGLCGEIVFSTAVFRAKCELQTFSQHALISRDMSVSLDISACWLKI